ncbi:MAG: hypothetical protein ACTS3R_21390 [Inquilinaceae bacterium]
MDAVRSTLIGIVGYSPVLTCYPLGPRLMTALKAATKSVPGVRVDNMTWGPIHIVQQFQDQGVERPDRLVLIGGAAVSTNPGRVRAFRWTGGTLPDVTMQGRIYEAVTGIVDIENTLMIGEHFEIWPTDCFTIEADMPVNAFGRMVIADTEGWADDRSLKKDFGFSPSRMIERIVELADALAQRGEAGATTLQTKSAADLVPVSPFTRNFSSEPASRHLAGGQP